MRRLFTTLSSTPLKNDTLLRAAPAFESMFPNVLSHVKNFPNMVQIGIPQSAFLQQNEVFHDQIAPEIIKKIPEWVTLMKMNRKRVCYHILRVMYCFLISPDFEQYSAAERNMMYWTIMLHDVCKRGIPVLPTAKDPFHPYASAAYSLKFFADQFPISEAQRRQSYALCDKILQAKLRKIITFYELRKNTWNTFELECSDLSQLADLMVDLNSIYAEGTFENMVVKLIMMHQSVPTLEKFRIDNQLKEAEVGKYVNKQLLRYIKTFTICDSNSYILNINRHLIPLHLQEFDTVFRKYESLCPE